MNETEYKSAMDKLNADFITAKNKLFIQYGLSQAKYKKGDIIQDHRWTIMVDRVSIGMAFLTNMPTAVYHGVELTKDLKPKKNGSVCTIWQSETTLTLIKAAEINQK